MSADLLRRAAAKIREIASDATKGPWGPTASKYTDGTYHDHVTAEWDIEVDVCEVPATPQGAWDAEHIALWSPDVAELVARVLDESAGWCEMYDDPGEAERVLHAEFALARRILGEDA